MMQQSPWNVWLLVGASVFIAGTSMAQTPPPADPGPPPAPPAVTVITQPPAATPPPVTVVTQPPAAQPALPANVIVLQPVAPVQAPPAQPGAQAPLVYVYDLPPPPPPPQRYTPPPPPPAKAKKGKRARRGVHTHDGFYMRGGLGVGALVLGSARESESELTLSTGGAAIDLAMGGTVGKGFVIGGRLLGVGGDALRLDNGTEQVDVDGQMSLASLQLFADWYPEPKHGFHLQLGLGPSGLVYDPTPDEAGDDEVSLDGFGGALGVGLEGWVGEQWSLGGLLQLQWATFDGSLRSNRTQLVSQDLEASNDRVIAVAPMLMLTVTHH